MGKPHFSYARIKPKQDVLATAPNGAPQEYRAVGYIQFKQEWNDLSKSYVPLTAEQQAKCDELHQAFAEVGAEIGITLTQRNGSDNVRDYPRVMQFKLIVNEPDAQAAPSSSPAPAPAPSAFDLGDNPFGDEGI